MRTLHVAAMPYPSHQGTQALIHAMLSALADAGHETHLLCYGHGAFVRSSRYRVHRLAWSPKRGSLRSGPSLEKVLEDVALVSAMRRHMRDLRPDLVVAHHVEGAAVALLARARPLLFLAHTSLEAELGTYLPRPFRTLCAHAGRALDRALCARSQLTLAVAPLLAHKLSADTGTAVLPLNLPWQVAPPTPQDERDTARRALGFSARNEVVLYAGNLDAYQGLSTLAQGLSALAPRRPELRWLVATQSDVTPLVSEVRRLGLAPWLRLTSLASEQERRRAYAASDVVAVPRGTVGGVPVKLLDALARGAHVITTRRALSGLFDPRTCRVIDDDDPLAWRAALDSFFSEGEHGPARGRSYIEQAHSPAGFVADLLRHADACQQASASAKPLLAGLFRGSHDE